MITQSSYRNHSNRGEELLHEGLVGPDRALASMLQYELGFGGEVTEASLTKITVVTRVMNCLDRTSWWGKEEEMLPLVTAAALWMRACSMDETHFERAWNAVSSMDERGERTARPFDVVNASPIFVGQSRIKTVMILSMGVENESEIKGLLNLGLEDILPAIRLAEETNTPLCEVLSQI